MRRIGTMLVIVSSVLLMTTPAYAHSNKIGICHSTHSESNSYVYIEVDASSLNGHGDHEDDLIGVTKCPDGGSGTTTTTSTVPPSTSVPTTSTVPVTTSTVVTVPTTIETTTSTEPEETTTTWLAPTTTSIVPVSTTTLIVPIVPTTSTIAPVTTSTTLDVPPVTDPPQVVRPTVTTSVPLISNTSTSLAQPGPNRQSESSTTLYTTPSGQPSTQTVSELAKTGSSLSLAELGGSMLLIGLILLGISRKIA